MNVSTDQPEEELSRIFKALSTPARLRILAAIGETEACVCHLEALLDLRQAYISQQLMELREAGLLETRREGRYIYYRLTKPKLLAIFSQFSTAFGIVEDFQAQFNAKPIPQCCCPHCVESLKTSSLGA